VGRNGNQRKKGCQYRCKGTNPVSHRIRTVLVIVVMDFEFGHGLRIE
jgi:hypothetical protein